MKKWVKNVAFATVLVGSSLSFAYHMGFQYKVPAYATHVYQKNTELKNYERELSVSLSFDKKKTIETLNEPLSNLDGSLLLIHEHKSMEGHALDYSLTSQGEDFIGKQIYRKDELVVKSPMYHRYIDFYGTTYAEEEKSELTFLKTSLYPFLKEASSDTTLYRNVGANEKGIKTLVIKAENEAIENALTSITSDVSEGIPYESVLYNHEVVTNRLLKQHKTDTEVHEGFKDTLSSFEKNIQSVLSDSKVTDSEIVIKITGKRIINEWSATINMAYTNPETNETVPFTIYADMSTWNVGKAQIEQIDVDPTNSIPYEKMTDDIDFFEDENLQTEVGALEDKEHAKIGFKEKNSQVVQENVTTFKEIGDDFTPVLPDKK